MSGVRFNYGPAFEEPDSGDVAAAIQRLRKYASKVPPEHLEGLDDDISSLLAEVERLRAEREALHSNETRERIRALVSRQARALGDGSITPGVLATLVMNLLAADTEADQ